MTVLPVSFSSQLTITSQLYGLVFVQSESAFALMVSASIIFLVSSYVIPQAILLLIDRNQCLPERDFDLGRFGYAVNLFSTLSTLLLIIACCLPTAFPITYTNMNYNRYNIASPYNITFRLLTLLFSIVTACLLIFVWLGWMFSRRDVFKGPTLDRSLLAKVRGIANHDTRPANEHTPLMQ